MEGLPNLDPVAARTRCDDIVDAIRRAILRGDLSPGQRVTEARLTEQLGVSRPTLREALRQLVHEGWLAQEPFKGVRVMEPDVGQLLHVAKVRVSLEALAVELCGQRPQEDLEKELRPLLQGLAAAVKSEDTLLVHEMHARLHGQIYRSSGNPILARIWSTLDAQVGQSLALDQAVRPNLKRILREHEVMVNALLDGDVEVARDAVRHHVEGNAMDLASMLERRRAKPAGDDASARP